MVSYRDLLQSGYGRIAVGIVVLEFFTGLSVYITYVVVPHVLVDLHAVGAYPLVVSSNSVGIFLAFALAQWVLRTAGGPVTLAGGLALSILGAAASATASNPYIFAVGRFAGAFGGGLLGVFGLSVVIGTLPIRYRQRLIALTSAMWIIPGLFGPSLALAAENLMGWRLTILLAVPGQLVARILLGRAALNATDKPHASKSNSIGRALLLPVGMAVFVGLSGTSFSAWAWIGLLVAFYGAWTILPRGIFRAAAGAPRAMALLAITALGYFGASELATTMAERADGIPARWIALALGGSAVMWSLTSLVQPRCSGAHMQRQAPIMRAGLFLILASFIVIAVLQQAASLTSPVLAACWIVAGTGMGLAYPAIYLSATTDTRLKPLDAGALATGVLLSESLGSILGAAIGSGIVQVAQRSGFGEPAGLHLAMLMYAVVIGCAVLLGLRTITATEKVPGRPV